MKKIFSALLLTLAGSAWAAEDYRVSHFDERIEVDSAGKSTVHTGITIHLLTEAGVRQFGQYLSAYNAEMQTLTLEAAATIKKNGTRIDVDREKGVFDKPLPITVDAPQFSQMHGRVITFPSLEVGDSIQVGFKQQDLTTLFPGKFAAVNAFPLIEVYEDANITLTTPADMAVKIESSGLEALTPATPADGKRTVRFHYSNAATGPIKKQSNTLSWFDVAPRFFATNFTDYRELANAYAARAQDKTQVTPAVQKLADELTRGITDRREQAEHLYQWVSENIRYVGVYIGAGGVVPHEADSILTNRYGDCKDHTTLYETLLKAKGIESSTVLINWGDNYRLPGAPVNAAFNHAITWLPEFKLFADTTPGFASFGTLPFGESDKSALIVATGEIRQTPIHNATTSQSFTDYTLALAEDGSAKLELATTLSGEIAENARRYLSTTQPDDVERKALEAYNLVGSLKLNTGKPHELGQNYVVTGSGKFDQFANFPGPFGFAIPRLPSQSNIKAFPDFVLQQKGKPLDGTCAGGLLEEHYHISFPASVKILAIPRNVDLSSDDVIYRATYQQQGNKIEVSRVLERNLKSNICSGAKLATWSGIASAIDRDLKSQILYQ
ncbi:DUF3857 domain-containing transglutaminase family protein [Andreprevotia chitinilytica]|uniref:DUF3857 domain-containing transglutaminase family protein n=1 Tax=Andreprevotia chitinilytica TaxID=396808 RepID=UPI0005558F90|nr:DUF3857 and transglutaminase domain-containing protein [Andreprevotia chitinilytica]